VAAQRRRQPVRVPTTERPLHVKLERYSRSARRLHTAVYLLTLFLLATGWWLLVGREGEPSPVARPLVLARRGVAAFMRETLRRDPGDLGWLLRWPLAIVTGRFARHEGHFDPGQRIANVAIVGLLVALIASGIGLVLVHFGPVFVVLAAVHRLATFAFTVVIAGHILVAAGILPGYRGAWRSMHLGGRVRIDTARRLWPGWTEREQRLKRRPGDREASSR